MEGLIFIIIAFTLMIAEAHLPTLGVLGIAGVVSLLVGGHFIVEAGGLFGYPIGWDTFIAMAVASVLIMIFYGYVIARNYGKKPVAGVEGMIGHDAKVIEWGGKEGRVQVQGELWAATSLQPHDFAQGDIVTISGVKDMTLHIHSK